LLRLGVMVSLRDYARMEVPGVNFHELLLFNGDLDSIDDTTISSLRKHGPPVEFVHVQESVAVGAGEELVDLSSDDERIRTLSVEVVSRTRELARCLGDVPIVIHPGGIRPSPADRERLAANLESSLESLGPSLLLLENMPWYYWFRKRDRMVSNLCVSQKDMERFADMVEGFTLDLCHGYLSRPEGDEDFCDRFMDRFGARVRHLHVSDAAVPDREGMQIGEGEIDFSWLRGSDLPMLVEIWNGHEDGARGFREGVERLRRVEAHE
jgi:sugar phosphate isomerase/epimerase